MRKLFTIIVLMLMVNLAVALEVSEELKTNVLLKEFNTPIQMDVTATNASSGPYNVYTLSEIVIDPSTIFQHPGGVLEKTVYLTANDRLDVDGYYVFTYTLNQRDVEQVSRRVTLNLLSVKDVLDISTNVIMLNDTTAQLTIRNLEQVELKDLEIEFNSVLFDSTEVISLSPLGEATVEVVLDADKLRTVKAGTYIIDAKIPTPEGEVLAQGKLYLNEEEGIRVEEDSYGIFVRTTTINKINAGNTVEDVVIQIGKNIISRLFTRFSVEPSSVERNGGKVMFTWNDRLYPSDNLAVTAKTNWLFPFLVVILLMLVYFAVRKMVQKKVEIKKSVKLIKTKGGDFALKVHIAVKAKKDVENVSLIDKIPPMLKLYNKFATIRPSKIDAHSRKMQWILGNLEAGEERILDYIVYSKVGVLGKFSLPSARAVFEKEGKIYETNSNDVFFLSSQTERG